MEKKDYYDEMRKSMQTIIPLLKNKESINEFKLEYERLLDSHVDKMVLDVGKRQSEIDKELSKFKRGLILAILLLFILITYFGAKDFVPSNEFINKRELTSSISKIINNGGDIETIRHSYKENYLRKYSEINYLFNKDIIRENDKPKLNDILLNLKEDFYSGDSTNRLIVSVSALDEILSEYTVTNAFDQLHVNQKYFFNNVYTKLDSNYYLVEKDVEKIADVLNEKNKLVTEYLSNSKSSFRNSMIAMTISSLSILLVLFLNLKSIKELLSARNVKLNKADNIGG